MDGAGQGFPAAEVIWEVHCQLCPGLVDRVPEPDVEPLGDRHIELVHPLAGAGRHWEAWKASAVCDVCYAILELPCWEHVSDPPTHAGGGRDESGEWLLCDICHAYRVQGRCGPWVRYAYTSSIDRAPGSDTCPQLASWPCASSWPTRSAGCSSTSTRDDG